MAFPIRELLDYDGNVYTLTCATIRRSMQLARISQLYGTYEEYTTTESLDSSEKPLTTALKEVLSGSVEFRLD